MAELFFQSGRDADRKASELRRRGLDVAVTPYAGGYTLVVTGPEDAVQQVMREAAVEQQSQPPRTVTGTVRWWSDEKGYGRITGDDGYVYFCHFSAIESDGYRSLAAGQRVEFLRVEGVAEHGRAGAACVRVIDR